MRGNFLGKFMFHYYRRPSSFSPCGVDPIVEPRHPRGVTPNSVMAVVPTMMAPASRKSRTMWLSWSPKGLVKKKDRVVQ